MCQFYSLVLCIRDPLKSPCLFRGDGSRIGHLATVSSQGITTILQPKSWVVLWETSRLDLQVWQGACVLSCPTLCDPCGLLARQIPLSMGFSRQEYWSGLPFPSPGDLLDPGIEPRYPALQADALTSKPPGKLWVIHWVLPSELPFSQEAGSLTWDPGKLRYLIIS